MKYINDRHEIAKAMNYGHYPVLHIDLETPMRGWDDAYEGDRVVVVPKNATCSEQHVRARINKFADEPDRYTVMPDPIFLDSSFGYSDVIEMMKWAQAPRIMEGQEVIVVEDWPKAGRCAVHKMRVSKCARPFTFPTCYLEDIDGKGGR